MCKLTHTHICRQSQLNAILHGILNNFLLCPVCCGFFLSLFSCFFRLFFSLLFGCQLCATFPQWGRGCQPPCQPASLPALFILLCAHYARPATITMKTVFNEIFEQVSRTHTGRPRGRARERGGHVFCTYAEKYAAINCSSSSGRHLVF